LLAEINADRIAGLRSRTLSGHPYHSVALLFSELRLFLPLPSFFFSLPLLPPQSISPNAVGQCEEVAKNGGDHSVRKAVVVSPLDLLPPFLSPPSPPLFSAPFCHRALLVSTFVTDGQRRGASAERYPSDRPSLRSFSFLSLFFFLPAAFRRLVEPLPVALSTLG